MPKLIKSAGGFAPIIGALQGLRHKYLAFDNDGTLIPIHQRPSESIPPEETLKLLRGINSLVDVKVILVTGRPKEYCDQYFSSAGVDMICEHGLLIKSSGNGWQFTKGNLNAASHNTSLEQVRDYLSQLTKVHPGSELEDKSIGVVWHYRNAKKLGDRIEPILQELNAIIRGSGFSVTTGKKNIEIKLLGVNKGTALKQYLKFSGFSIEDGVLTAGDDTTDEDMYGIFPERNISCHVGNPNFKARYHISEQSLVTELLRSLLRIL